MAFEEGTSGNMYMPVAPAYGGGFGGNGFGGDWAWIIILLLAFNGGWGMGGFGGFGGYGNMQLSYDFPWLLQGQNAINANTNSGFDHAATQSAIGDLHTAVTSGFGDVATQLCGGFASVNATVTGALNAVSQQLYTNQISDLERSFAAQTANTQGLTALQGQLAQCCCDNRLATCQTQNTVATEAATTRAANAANTQAILDKLCALELDGYKRENDNLRTQLNMAQLSASQNAQTAAIEASQSAQTQYIVNRVAPYPIPAYTVANPNTGCCNTGCGFNG